MANNPAQDRYNPPATNESSFDETRFGEVEVDDLFYLGTNENGDMNPVHRKINEGHGANLKTGFVAAFDRNKPVWTKS
tara:strand:+ start:462 stop:695 length:234 start_codon:yes stop_codon:yes gene_type:complete